MAGDRISTAMVFAAGLGTRMRPLTNDRPKALVEVGGKTLIDHMLDRLAAAEVERAVVNVHHFADRLEAHLQARAAPKIDISDERDRLLETGGGFVRARSLLGDAALYVCNSDTVWLETTGSRSALSAMRDAFDPERMDALLLLTETERALGFPGAGDFHRDAEGRITRRGEAATAQYAYIGAQILNPALADGFPEERFSLNKFWDVALERGRLFGHVLDGEWMHVGDPAARDAAEAKLAAAWPL